MQNMKKVVYGQDDAIEQIVDKIMIAQAGLKRDNKPIGSFVLMGPTGCGKTETAKQLSNQLGVKFYHRKNECGGSSCDMKNSSRDCKGRRCSVHDHFLYDFIENVECDYLIQMHTTSPLIEPNTIREFTNTLIEQ